MNSNSPLPARLVACVCSLLVTGAEEEGLAHPRSSWHGYSGAVSLAQPATSLLSTSSPSPTPSPTPARRGDCPIWLRNQPTGAIAATADLAAAATPADLSVLLVSLARGGSAGGDVRAAVATRLLRSQQDTPLLQPLMQQQMRQQMPAWAAARTLWVYTQCPGGGGAGEGGGVVVAAAHTPVMPPALCRVLLEAVFCGLKELSGQDAVQVGLVLTDPN